MGVNDLIECWKVSVSGLVDCCSGWGRGCYSATESCWSDVERVAREAWRPVSEPPTEADGDDLGYVLFASTKGALTVDTIQWWEVANPVEGEWGTHMLWARVRDVVLLPEGEGE